MRVAVTWAQFAYHKYLIRKMGTELKNQTFYTPLVLAMAYSSTTRMGGSKFVRQYLEYLQL